MSRLAPHLLVGAFAASACGPMPTTVPTAQPTGQPTASAKNTTAVATTPSAGTDLPAMELHSLDGEVHLLGFRGVTLLGKGRWFGRVEGSVLTWQPCLSKGLGEGAVSGGWGPFPEDAYVQSATMDGTRSMARWDRLANTWRYTKMPGESPRDGYLWAHAPDHGLVRLELSSARSGQSWGAFLLLERGVAGTIQPLPQRFREDMCMASDATLFDLAVLGPRLTVICSRGVEWWNGTTPTSEQVPLPLADGHYTILTSGAAPLIVPAADGHVIARLESNRWSHEPTPAKAGLSLLEEHRDGTLTFAERDARALWTRAPDGQWSSETIPFDAHHLATAADGTRIALAAESSLWVAPPGAPFAPRRLPDGTTVDTVTRLGDLVLLQSSTAAWTHAPLAIEGQIDDATWSSHPEQAPPCLQ